MRISDWSSDVCSSDLAEAVADIEEAVRVEIADIARSKNAVDLERAPLFSILVIGEIGLERLVDADLARLARPAGLAGSAPDRQANALDRTPHRPAMRKPVVRSAEGQRPRLGRAIIFEDHRPPPVDHPDLHVGRAGDRKS